MIPTIGGLRRQQTNEMQAPTNTSKAPETKEPAASVLPATGTVVRWQDELADRIQVSAPTGMNAPMAVTPGAQAPLYQVAVSPEGMTTHCVLIDSSGDPRSDEAGRVWIMAQRFQPAASSSWGRVLILWGAGAPAPAVSTNPPATP